MLCGQRRKWKLFDLLFQSGQVHAWYLAFSIQFGPLQAPLHDQRLFDSQAAEVGAVALSVEFVVERALTVIEVVHLAAIVVLREDGLLRK